MNINQRIDELAEIDQRFNTYPLRTQRKGLNHVWHHRGAVVDHDPAKSASSTELKLIFDHLDKDGNGSIDVHELAELSTLLGESWEADYIHTLIGHIDTDGNGVISFDEFEKWHNSDSSIKGHSHCALNLEHKERIHAYSQLLNVRFAKQQNILFSLGLDGALEVPGFYLLEDYQKLFQGVVSENSEYNLEIEGVIPLALRGAYFVTGPGVLEQDGENVHPFDGHGFIRRFEIDGSRGRGGRVTFKSRFVRTSSFLDEIDNASEEAIKAMPIIHRGVGTNTQIWRNFLHLKCMFGKGLVPIRNPRSIDG